MACPSCAGRRKIISQIVNGNKPIGQGASQIAKSLGKDVRTIANAIRPSRIGMRVKM